MTIKMYNKIVMIADTIDDNGRIYPREALLSLCDDIEKEYTGSFSNVNFSVDKQKQVIVSSNLHMEGNILLCDFTIVDTVYGCLLQKYIKEQPFTLTPHGIGKVDESGVVSEYQLININVKLT